MQEAQGSIYSQGTTQSCMMHGFTKKKKKKAKQNNNTDMQLVRTIRQVI